MSLMEIKEMTETKTKTKEHLLSSEWCLWTHKPQESDWTINGFKKIYTVKSVEETIAIMETLPEVLVKNCMLFFMKKDVGPNWEHPLNRDGGYFSYKILNKNVYEVWKKMSYLITGNSISKNVSFVNAVTGITVSPKKNFCIIKLFMTDCLNQNAALVSQEISELSQYGCLFKKHTPEY